MTRGRVFYGWWVTIAFAVMVFLSTGVRFSVGPFLKPMVEDLGTDRASYSLVVSLSLFLYGLFMPFVGRLVERWGRGPWPSSAPSCSAPRWPRTGLVTQLWQLAVVYGVLVAARPRRQPATSSARRSSRGGSHGAGPPRSPVLGAASMAGMSLLVPVSMWLILTVGWRATYAIIGFVRGSSSSCPLPCGSSASLRSRWGSRPTVGAARSRGRAEAPAPERTTVNAMPLRTTPFWQLCGGMFTCGFSMSLLSAHGVPMLTDHGFPAMLASSAMGVLGASSFVGAMLLGAIADRFGRRPVLAWLYGTRALLFAAMFVVHDSPQALLVISTLGGASMSGSLAMTSALTADIFGRFSVGSVFGSIFVVHQGGAALGSWLGGLLFELTGGYGAAFAIAAVQLLLAAAVSLTIDEAACGATRLRPVAAER